MGDLQIIYAVLVLSTVAQVFSGPDPWDKPYKDWEFLDPNLMPVAETSLRNVLVVSKHGIHYPRSNKLKDDEYPSFPDKKDILLTERGKQMMVRLGRLLMRRYEGFIRAVENGVQTSKDPQRQFFKITSSESVVARSSANELLRGMFGDDKTSYQVEEGDQRDFDKSFITLQQKSGSDCPKFTEMRDKNWKPDELLSKKIDPDWKLLKQLLGVTKLHEVFEMYERLEMERLSGLSLPKWAEGANGLRITQAMRRVSILRMRKILGDSEDVWKFLTSTLLARVLEEFDYVEFVQDGTFTYRSNQKRHIHIHITDDYLLYTLMWWLRLDDIATCSTFIHPSTPGQMTCRDVVVPTTDQKPLISLTQGGTNIPPYYAQVGDTLILEFHESNKNNKPQKYVKPYFLRVREEENSFKGFWWLTMSKKLYQLGEPYSSNDKFEPSLLASGIIPPKKWKGTCSASIS